MTAEHLQMLPPWLQVVLTIVTFAGALWVYMSGLFKNLPKPPIPAAKPTDVVVPAMTFADGKIIEKWVEEIRKGNVIDEERSELVEKQLWVLERIEENVAALKHDLVAIRAELARR